MTVSEWIKNYGNDHKYEEFTIAYDKDNTIIFDGRIYQIPTYADSYNKAWRAECRGKQIVRTADMPHGICLFIAKHPGVAAVSSQER